MKMYDVSERIPTAIFRFELQTWQRKKITPRQTSSDSFLPRQCWVDWDLCPCAPLYPKVLTLCFKDFHFHCIDFNTERRHYYTTGAVHWTSTTNYILFDTYHEKLWSLSMCAIISMIRARVTLLWRWLCVFWLVRVLNPRHITQSL